MNIAAYCRVSTDKEDQLNSLEAQKRFFAEYTGRTGDKLVRLYADEGISGTKIRNRREFLRMMSDAEEHIFDMVVVKDISRFARNTVDLLQNIRRLKALGIETQFLTAGMTSMGSSEFVLTIFGAIAQEESANTSKRVKFGKRLNAEKGRVPNLVYGYDKTAGDYFNLTVNEAEAAVVREIFHLYNEEGYGAAKIASGLNARGLVTKRGCAWSQNAVSHILKNELYTGRVVNGKQEVADFLTGRREARDETEWIVVDKPELRIIGDDTFLKAREILRSRLTALNTRHERQSSKYLFSTLIKCRECGWSFRRTVRTYKNTYVRWVCSGHNEKGAESCPNSAAIDEEELTAALKEHFTELLKEKRGVLSYVINHFLKLYSPGIGGADRVQELSTRLSRLKKSRQRYMDMYADDLITREELNEKLDGTMVEMQGLKYEMKKASGKIAGGDELEAILHGVFRQIEDITDLQHMTNAQLKRIIEKIEVDSCGNVDIYLRPLGDAGPQCHSVLR